MALFARRKERLGVAVDLRGDGISAVLFTQSVSPLKGKPRGVKKITTPLPYGSAPLKILSTLHEVLYTAIKQTERAPEKIFIGLGPDIVPSTLEVRTIKTGGMKRIGREELKSAFKQLVDESLDHGHAVIAHPVGITANGYDCDADTLIRQDPALVNEIGFRLIVAIPGEEISEDLYRLRQMFGGISIEFIPLMAAYTDGIVGGLGASDTFFVDIEWGSTLLALIGGGRLLHIASFPSGARQFVEMIAREKHISIAQAHAIERQYIHKWITEEVKSAYRPLFAKASSQWQEAFTGELDAFDHLGIIPSDILISGQGAYIPEIRQAFSDTRISQRFDAASPLKTILLNGTAIFGGNTINETIGGCEDAALASLLFYASGHKPLF